MLRRTCVRGMSSASVGATKIGNVHPDAAHGHRGMDYAGPGWLSTFKILPMDNVMAEGGMGGFPNTYNRVGQILDPEDPRHSVVVYNKAPIGMGTEDLSLSIMTQSITKSIPESSKLLAVLYENYLEPFSMNRVAVHLGNWEKVPNNHHESLGFTCDYIGQTASIIGDVTIATGAVVMEGVTLRADANAIYVAEGVQLMENVCVIADAPTTLHHYQRRETINPYQVFEAMEGVVKIGQNSMVEANCHIESCIIGPFNKIGHGSHIMKGVQTGSLAHILPGSIVVQDTKIGDGELWGGAPAVKLGKVSKYEWKKPFHASMLHREAVVEGHGEENKYGAQMVQFAADCELINDVLVEYEGEVSPAIRAQVRQLMDGREPFDHTLAREMQLWSAAGRTELYQGGRGQSGIGGGAPFWDRPWFMSHSEDSDPSWGPTGSLCPLWEFWIPTQRTH